jgi:hypothetical protein
MGSRITRYSDRNIISVGKAYAVISLVSKEHADLQDTLTTTRARVELSEYTRTPNSAISAASSTNVGGRLHVGGPLRAAVQVPAEIT